MSKTIERILELDAAPDDVWRALTDPTELSGWFGDSAELNPDVGGEGWFGWEAHGKFAVRVEEWDPPQRFSWRWAREAGKPLDQTSSTLVEWTLTPRAGGGTILKLRESGFLTEEHWQQNDGGWTEELEHLQSFLSEA